jgi:hypothetical protein
MTDEITALTQRRYSVDEFVGTVSQGRRSSPAGADAKPADNSAPAAMRFPTLD